MSDDYPFASYYKCSPSQMKMVQNVYGMNIVVLKMAEIVCFMRI